MTSQRRINSSRANGAKSKGPTTPEGKARSSMNALRHGLLAQNLLLTGENRAAFDATMQMHIDHFQPLDGVEFGIVEDMVACQWRLNRCWAIETHNFDQQIANCPFVAPNNDNIDRISAAFLNVAEMPYATVIGRYESRFQLQYQRAVRTLAMIRKMPPNKPNPISEHNAELLAKMPAPPQPIDSKPKTTPTDAAAHPPASQPNRPATAPTNPPAPQKPPVPYASQEIAPLRIDTLPLAPPENPSEDAA